LKTAKLRIFRFHGNKISFHGRTMKCSILKFCWQFKFRKRATLEMPAAASNQATSVIKSHQSVAATTTVSAWDVHFCCQS